MVGRDRFAGGLDIVTRSEKSIEAIADSLSGIRILIVDDDEGARSWLREIFARVGCEVKEARSGLTALDELAENGPFHLVVTDVYMPSPSGLQLVAMARTTGYEGPFLLVTAFPDPEMADFASDSRHTELLVKPFTADEILLRASSLVGECGGPC